MTTAFIPVARVNNRLPTLAFGVSWDATVAKAETVLHCASSQDDPFGVFPSGQVSSFIDLQLIVVALRVGGGSLAHVDGDAMEALEGALAHTGDEKTGMKDGWDEMATLNLGFLPPEAESLALFVHCKSGHTLGDTKDIKCAVFSLRDQQPLLGGALGGKTTSSLVGLLRRQGEEFVLQPINYCFNAHSLETALAVARQVL